MYCEKCGQILSVGSRVCARCGTVASADAPASLNALVFSESESEPETAHERMTRRVSPGVTLGQDGVMRWVYQVNMWKNPTLVITTWKLLMLAALVPALLVGVLAFADGDGASVALGRFVQVGGLVAAIVTALMLLAYPLVSIINGGRYCVIFEMDGAGLRHIHMQRQFRRSQVLAMVTVLAGALSASAPATGAGLLAGARRSLYTRFSDVRAVVAIERRHVIHLVAKLARNQVYAEPADYGFVLNHIDAHCKPAVKYR